MTAKFKLITGVAALLLAACATFGVVADTFEKRVAAANTAAIGAVETVEQLVVVEKITPDDGDNALDQIEVIKKGLDVARKIGETGDLSTAEAKLAAVQLTLDALLEYLAELEEKP